MIPWTTRRGAGPLVQSAMSRTFGGPQPPDRRRGRSSLTVEGTVREALPNAMFSIELDNGQKVLGHVSNSMRTRTVRVLPGDRVTVELSPYDLSRGRITARHR